ncbi:hypothetical protein D3C76_1027770 [compost metagenome]
MVHLRGIASRILGAIKGDVGALEQVGWRRAVVGNQGNTDTRRHLQALAVEEHRLGQQLTNGIGQLADLIADLVARAFEATEQHHEFITAQARDGVFHAHAGFQARGDDFQHRVAHRMAEGIVDVLEVVEVEEHQRAAQVMALEQGDLLAQAIHQQRAVGQVGQRVVVGQVTDLRLGVLQQADVPGGQQQARGFVEGDRFYRDLDRQQLAALVAPEHLQVMYPALDLQFGE